MNLYDDHYIGDQWDYAKIEGGQMCYILVKVGGAWAWETHGDPVTQEVAEVFVKAKNAEEDEKRKKNG